MKKIVQIGRRCAVVWRARRERYTVSCFVNYRIVYQNMLCVYIINVTLTL